jgi:hypothetical protein
VALGAHTTTSEAACRCAATTACRQSWCKASFQVGAALLCALRVAGTPAGTLWLAAFWRRYAMLGSIAHGHCMFTWLSHQ